MNYSQLCNDLYKDLHEFGFLTDALENPFYNDIECFGVGKGNLLCSKNGKNHPLTNINGEELYFTTAKEVEELISKLSFTSTERLSKAKPSMRCNTIQGYRLTAQDKSMTYQYENDQGVMESCPTFSIRLTSGDTITVQSMVQKINYHAYGVGIARAHEFACL